MIIKLAKVVSRSSEHPSYPAENLLHTKYDTTRSWRCAKPGELLAWVIFEFVEPSIITGVLIGNYRCCDVLVSAATAQEPDNWINVASHRFMTHAEAQDGKFKDQVRLFRKVELDINDERKKFSRAKIMCMQPSNLRELFGLCFVVFHTEAGIEPSEIALLRFIPKKPGEGLEAFKQRYFKQLPEKGVDYKEVLAQHIRDIAAENCRKRLENPKPPMKRPILEQLERDAEEKEKQKEEEAKVASMGDAKKDTKQETKMDIKQEPKKDTKQESKKDTKQDTQKDIKQDRQNDTGEEDKKKDIKEVTKKEIKNFKNVARTPFGDVIPSPKNDRENKSRGEKKYVVTKESVKKKENNPAQSAAGKCSDCSKNVTEDSVCKTCHKLPQPKPATSEPPKKKPKTASKKKKEFKTLMNDVTFALSGYINEQRDDIRRKALAMGARYVANPDVTNNPCSHLVSAFKNTPKVRQLKGHSKIVSHQYIEECYEKKIRFPWRRFALDRAERAEPESEEEIEGFVASATSVFQRDTDSESDY